MKLRLIKRATLRATQTVAVGMGAAALGACAVGAIAVGSLAIGGLLVRKARFRSVEIDDLTVHRLRILEPTPDLQKVAETK
jgi:hypothetical protein